MKIGLIDVDYKHTHYPNLALMKISRYHKNVGNEVEWYTPFSQYDSVYKSKIFNYTEDDYTIINNAKKVFIGGTGLDIKATLPEEIEYLQPDYSIYNIDKKMSLGFLTRGCPNRCSWCVVPEKEGAVKAYMSVEDIAIEGRTNIVLMDNNILALKDYAIEQLNKIIFYNYKVDFNQALDARLVDDNIAKLLATMRSDYIRFGCDTRQQIEKCEEAMKMIDYYRKKPKKYIMYIMLHNNIYECHNRIEYWKRYNNVVVQAQPFRNPYSINHVPEWQKALARWANRRWIYKKCDFKDFQVRKGITGLDFLQGY